MLNAEDRNVENLNLDLSFRQRPSSSFKKRKVCLVFVARLALKVEHFLQKRRFCSVVQPTDKKAKNINESLEIVRILKLVLNSNTSQKARRRISNGIFENQ